MRRFQTSKTMSIVPLTRHASRGMLTRFLGVNASSLICTLCLLSNARRSNAQQKHLLHLGVGAGDPPVREYCRTVSKGAETAKNWGPSFLQLLRTLSYYDKDTPTSAIEASYHKDRMILCYTASKAF